MNQADKIKLRQNLFVIPTAVFGGLLLFFALLKSEYPDAEKPVFTAESAVNTDIPTTSSKVGKTTSEADQLNKRYTSKGTNNIQDYGAFLKDLQAKEKEDAKEKENIKKNWEGTEKKEQILLQKLQTTTPDPTPSKKRSEDERAQLLAQKILEAKKEKEKQNQNNSLAPEEPKIPLEQQPVEVEEMSKPRSRFFSSTTSSISNKREIKAEILPQTIKNGSSIALLLMEDSYSDDGFLIPKGTTIYAVSSFSRNRVNLKIESVRLNNNIYKYKKTIFDLDSMEGLAVPDNLRAEFNKSLTDQGIDQSANIVNNTTSGSSSGLLNSAVSGVSSVAKNLLKKQNNEVPVPIKANYKVLLR